MGLDDSGLEYGFEDFVSNTGTKYRFDFAVFKQDGSLDFLIEYQGNIHFKIGSGWNNEERLADNQRRDKLKFDYCKKNGIKLHYITYEEIVEERMEEIFSE